MKVRRAWVVAARILRQRLRDKRTLAVLLLQPLLILAVFGGSFSDEITNVQVAIANLDRGTIATDVIEKIDRDTIHVILLETDAQVEHAILTGSAQMGVVFPPNFTRNLEQGDDGLSIILYLDNTNPLVTLPAQGALADAFDDALEARFDRKSGFTFEERIVFGPEDPDTLAFTLPGVIAFTVFFLSGLLTAVPVITERTRGTLERMLVSPTRPSEIVVGYMIALGTVAIGQVTTVLAASAAVSDLEINVGMLIALLVAALVAFSAMGFGLLASGLARSEFQAVQAVVLFTFPTVFISGVFRPTPADSPILQALAKVVPLSYAVDAMRDTLNHGASLLDVLPDILMLSLFSVVFVMLGTLSLTRQTG